ncbi:hypothetical protein [Saccharopolyspora sp. NPDC050642]|uniref:hypothetical protein n=1 Tax=Saccharopolyspora sp. NPDC050642 TaxID=3157099 RepID=UPI0033C0D1EE
MTLRRWDHARRAHPRPGRTRPRVTRAFDHFCALDYVDDVRDEADKAGAGWWYWSNNPGSWGPYAPDGGWAPLARTNDG